MGKTKRLKHRETPAKRASITKLEQNDKVKMKMGKIRNKDHNKKRKHKRKKKTIEKAKG